MTRRSVLRTAALFTVLALTACGGKPNGQPSSSTTPSPLQRPSSPAKLSITSPTSGATLSPTGVEVRIELTGAKLTKKVTTNITPDLGHIHLVLDGRTITLLGSLDENLSKLLGRPLTAGPHLLQAEFVAADHGPFDPRVLASVSFTVR
ncbi:MAG TPA: hypothetical protein VF660_10570 [Actinomycetota bacterium]